MSTDWQQWHVTQLTPEAAEAWTRRSMGIPDHAGLGWTPYNYLVTYGAVSQWACYTEQEFERELRVRHLQVAREWTPWENGIRSTYLQEVSK